MLFMEDMGVFHATHRVHGIVLCCLWGAGKGSTLLVGSGNFYKLTMGCVDVFNDACVGPSGVPHFPWGELKFSTLLIRGGEVLHAAHGGCGSVPHCPWGVWMCSMLPMEGMEMFHAAHGGRESVPQCLWRAWQSPTLPTEVVEVFHTAR
jgi:hypothetical protein